MFLGIIDVANTFHTIILYYAEWIHNCLIQRSIDTNANIKWLNVSFSVSIQSN